MPHGEAFAEAKASALRALAMDSESADAQMALGTVLFASEWDWVAAERSLRRALQINPTHTEALLAYGGLMEALGRLEEGLRFPLCRPEALRTLWTDAGFGAVTVEPIDVPTVFTDFDDYWLPFLCGQGPAPGYVASLSEERRLDLRDLLSDRLPANADGRIALTARAWAVRGTVAG